MKPLLAVSALVAFSECRNEQAPLNIIGNQIPVPSTLSQPLLGFGTWNLKKSGSNTTDAVAIAIESGYRQIDCAAAYGNEKDVGKGIAKGLKKSKLVREEIWVTSKLWNDHHAPDRVEAGLNQTLSDLGLDYLDLYLMHWPVGKGPSDKAYQYDYVQTWQAMEQLLKTDRVRNIGISNFSPNQVRDLIEKSNIKPAVHQMELHPYLPQDSWIRAHQMHEISITAYSPLGNQNPTYGDRARRSPTTQMKAPLLLKDHIINEIAEKRGCTPAQVVLAWGMNRGTSVIPKSKHEKYIKENIGAIKCILQGDDFSKIGKLGEEPRRFNNPSRGWGIKLFEGLDDA